MPPKIDIKLDKELCDLICDIAVAFDCQREIDGTQLSKCVSLKLPSGNTQAICQFLLEIGVIEKSTKTCNPSSNISNSVPVYHQRNNTDTFQAKDNKNYLVLFSLVRLRQALAIVARNISISIEHDQPNKEQIINRLREDKKNIQLLLVCLKDRYPDIQYLIPNISVTHSFELKAEMSLLQKTKCFSCDEKLGFNSVKCDICGVCVHDVDECKSGKSPVNPNARYCGWPMEWDSELLQALCTRGRKILEEGEMSGSPIALVSPALTSMPTPQSAAPPSTFSLDGMPTLLRKHNQLLTDQKANTSASVGGVGVGVGNNNSISQLPTKSREVSEEKLSINGDPNGLLKAHRNIESRLLGSKVPSLTVDEVGSTGIKQSPSLQNTTFSFNNSPGLPKMDTLGRANNTTSTTASSNNLVSSSSFHSLTASALVQKKQGSTSELSSTPQHTSNFQLLNNTGINLTPTRTGLPSPLITHVKRTDSSSNLMQKSISMERLQPLDASKVKKTLSIILTQEPGGEEVSSDYASPPPMKALSPRNTKKSSRSKLLAASGVGVESLIGRSGSMERLTPLQDSLLRSKSKQSGLDVLVGGSVQASLVSSHVSSTASSSSAACRSISIEKLAPLDNKMIARSISSRNVLSSGLGGVITQDELVPNEASSGIIKSSSRLQLDAIPGHAQHHKSAQSLIEVTSVASVAGSNINNNMIKTTPKMLESLLAARASAASSATTAAPDAVVASLAKEFPTDLVPLRYQTLHQKLAPVVNVPDFSRNDGEGNEGSDQYSSIAGGGGGGERFRTERQKSTIKPLTLPLPQQDVLVKSLSLTSVNSLSRGPSVNDVNSGGIDHRRSSAGLSRGPSSNDLNAIINRQLGGLSRGSSNINLNASATNGSVLPSVTHAGPSNTDINVAALNRTAGLSRGPSNNDLSAMIRQPILPGVGGI